MMMAADVGSLVRILNSRYKEEGEEGKTELVTRDLLGGCGGILGASKELDLDLKAPLGWEKRLDLVNRFRSYTSGEVFLRRSSATAPSKTALAHLQDLNMAPPPPNLDLKLFPSSSSEYQSVCTLDKVRSALERAAKTKHIVRPRKPDGSSSPTSSSTTTTTTASAVSLKKNQRSGEEEEGESRTATEGSASGGGLMATGCPNCLSYVLISKGNPRCPRCDAAVSLPLPNKKPRIDLNLNTSA